VAVDSRDFTYRGLISELAKHARIPAMYGARHFVGVGGLAYGYDVADTFDRAAGYLDQILKGAEPGQILFYQATKFELVINLKTAKPLGPLSRPDSSYAPTRSL
jgi:putative ABC transport system substrate-binding protein